MTTTATTATTDIRLEAWSFGRKCAGSYAMAYRQLENGTPEAVRVFDAITRNEWGVKAALADGIRGYDITSTDHRTGVTIAWVGGAPYPDLPNARRRPVAANGGTI